MGLTTITEATHHIPASCCTPWNDPWRHRRSLDERPLDGPLLRTGRQLDATRAARDNDQDWEVSFVGRFSHYPSRLHPETGNARLVERMITDQRGICDSRIGCNRDRRMYTSYREDLSVSRDTFMPTRVATTPSMNGRDDQPVTPTE